MKGKLIWIVLILAFLLRFVNISSFPAGFNADEASFGYDAYSILHTARDQWGNVLPIVLKSFGDYKAPLLAYILIPFVAVFGLTTFSVRIAGAVVGTLAVLVVYLLVKEIGKLKISNSLKIENWKLEIIAGILLALNPWAIMISRGTFEFNLITLLVPLGIYLFLMKKYSSSALVFGLSLFSYHSAKVITPLVLFGLILISWRKLKKIGLKKLLAPAVILTVFIFGLVYTFKVGGGSRIVERSITQGTLEAGFHERMDAIDSGQSQVLAKLLHNKYTVSAKRFVTNYAQYFSFKFLFRNGAGEGSYGMIPGIGMLNFIEGILLLGIFPLLFLNKKQLPLILSLLAWLFISVVPSALASGVGYSGNRASGMLPVTQIIEVFGFVGWIGVLKKIKIKAGWAYCVFGILLLLNTTGFLANYFKTPSNSVLKQMDYSNLEVFKWLSENGHPENVVVSRSLSEPQIFIAFQNRWSPPDYQKYTTSWVVETWVDQIPEYHLGGYTIKSVDWDKDLGGSGFIISRADETPKGIIPLKVFNYPDGSPNIYIIDASQKVYAKST